MIEFQLKMNFNYNKEEILQFWVGLMEGNGSFQVNHWKYKSLQFRLIIKLKYTEANEKMLIEIKNILGGSYRRIKNKKVSDEYLKVPTEEFAWAIWVMNDREKILSTLQIFDKYPPLTSKAICGIAFMKTFLVNPDIKKYLETRNLKYENQTKISASLLEKQFIYPNYWGPWLAGFTEAEGCFSIRLNGSHSYSIAQKEGEAIIKAIREFFQIKASARYHNTMWSIETANTTTLKRIVKFFHIYPLLGEKAVSFSRFLSKKELKDQK